jgi:EAL domain-containing protein (putative c-di-GMP-specific phosphodiesterase class I)
VYGEVPPDEFIGTAEQTGQIRELTRFVIDEALRQCAEWNTNGQQLRMSVNLSVRNLLEPDLVDYLRDRLSAYQVPSWLLTLELTESHVMAESSRTPQLLGDLAGLGSRLSVDDFGTGYSSLAYLRRLPLRELKIDKSFVSDIASNGKDAAIVEAIIQLAHALQIDVVAEGIENAAAERLLRNLGCDLMQGYHLSKPMRADQLTNWLRDHRVGQRRPFLRALPTPRSEGLSVVETS